MKEKNWKYSVDYLKPLDGFRAIAILTVAWFHLWQLSWLQPYKEVSWLSFLNIKKIDFVWMVSTGYQMVDVMLLLSGFCLFLPYAKSMVMGGVEPELKSFYWKRVARIVPSYYFAVFVALLVAVKSGEYFDASQMREDLFSHLFFVHTYTKQGYIYTKLNGVLWTLAIEVQFYLIFPFIAKVFKKHPGITYIAMVAVSWMFDNWQIVGRVDPNEYSMWINQLPTFFSVYANGMMAALLYVKLADIFNKYLERDEEQNVSRNKQWIGYFFTGIVILCISVYYHLMQSLNSSDMKVLWQIRNRYEFTLLFAIFIIGSLFAVPLVQKLLGNPVMKFISGISFQLYIWHQFIAAQLKKNHIPFWEGDTEPNLLGDQVWMRKYFLLSCLAALVVSVVVTYALERPCAKLILKKCNKKKKGE